MCGFAGIVEFEAGREPSREGLKRMADVLVHRGPDEEGIWKAGSIGLAHRRLKIIDLVSGQQPLRSPDGRVWLAFNGEIYNFLDLKRDLEKKGVEFRTTSDTEVLLALYLEYGVEAFPRLNGMFACAFWDGRTDQLVLARDRIGKKPLFYYQDSHRLLFGSEMKALLAYGGIRTDIDYTALHEYLTYSYIVGEQTIIRGVHRVPPATVLTVRNRQQSRRSFWNFEFQVPQKDPKEEEVLESLDELLQASATRRMISDVPLGAFLSGGLDSSAVVALMARTSDRPIRTFSVGFDESDYSELDDARIVAKHLGTDHHETVVKPSAMDILSDLVWYLDEPFGDSSAVPTYYVCRAAREQVTVALSGDGGDELFAGYRRYLDLGRYERMNRVPGLVRRGLIKPLADFLPFTFPGWNYLYALGNKGEKGHPPGLGIYPYIQLALLSNDLKKELQDHDAIQSTRQILRNTSHLDPVSRFQYLDTLQYLPCDILTKVDRMSMANSLEVRAPLLDYTLVEYLATLPVSLKLRDGISKYIFRKYCRRLLPESVLTKPKQGFGIPKDQWFRTELRQVARDILLDSKTLHRGYFRKEAITRLLDHHVTGRRDYSTWIWCLIILEIWHRTFVDADLSMS